VVPGAQGRRMRSRSLLVRCTNTIALQIARFRFTTEFVRRLDIARSMSRPGTSLRLHCNGNGGGGTEPTWSIIGSTRSHGNATKNCSRLRSDTDSVESPGTGACADGPSRVG
jgi:hypothetical protein